MLPEIRESLFGKNENRRVSCVALGSFGPRRSPPLLSSYAVLFVEASVVWYCRSSFFCAFERTVSCDSPGPSLASSLASRWERVPASSLAVRTLLAFDTVASLRFFGRCGVRSSRTGFLSIMAPSSSKPTTAQSRLSSVLSTLKPAPKEERELIGTLKLGELAVPVYETHDPARLPSQANLLDWRAGDQDLIEHIDWLCRKAVLGEFMTLQSSLSRSSRTWRPLTGSATLFPGQDIFLISPPGPAARRLAYSFASVLNLPVEIVSLHRDVGESELKQGREIREGGRLEYTDSAAVRAAKGGAILILDGVERCERGVLPLLNNLLENREINLEDGEFDLGPSSETSS